MKNNYLRLAHKLGLHSLAILSFACGCATLSWAKTPLCEGEFSYERDIHGPAYEANRQAWDATLYQPLRRYFQSVLNLAPKGRKLHLVYIGAGERAMLLGDRNLDRSIERRIGEITLVDSDLTSARLARAEIQKRFPSMTTRIVVANPVRDLAEQFTQFVESAIPIKDRLSFEPVPMPNPAQLATAWAFQDAKIPAADIVYSEMKAAYSGIPVMIQLERDIQESIRKLRAKPKSPTRDEQILLRHWLFGTLRTQWAKFNSYAYQWHIAAMGAVTLPGGHIAIASDVAKIFDDEEDEPEKLRPSFMTPGLPQVPQPGLEVVRPDFREGILWRDQGHSDGLPAHEPHTHLVEVKTYLKSE